MIDILSLQDFIMCTKDYSFTKGEKMKMNRLMVIVSIIALSLGSLPAMAQKNTETASVVMDTITVTANKMEEDIHTVPQSISVIDATEIEEMGLETAMDVLNQIPGMLATPDHGVGVTFRGLKRSKFTMNNPVVIYVDGVPIANAFGFDLSLNNVERIEVLRGPQGTLYGKDAIGAVVNIITKDPDNTWQGKIGTKYSSWNTFHAKATVNGPMMADTLFLGLSGQYDKTDGWITNDYPGMDEDAGRNGKYDLNGFLLFTPTDRLRARLAVDQWEHTTHFSNEKALPYDSMGTGSGYASLKDFHRNMTEHLYMDLKSKEEISVNSQSLLLAYDVDRFQVESITTHRIRDLDGISDVDRSAGNLADGLIAFRDTKLTAWTEELRFLSTNATGLRWICGLYLDKETEESFLGMQMPGALKGMPFDIEMQAVPDSDKKTQAIFGQIMMPLGQRFELTLGGRYQRINKTMHQDMYFLPVQGPFHANVTGVSPLFSSSLDLDKTWNTFLPKAALTWFLTDNYTVYASFSQGYMPGGFSLFSMGGGAEENTFEPQTSINYEIGIKADHDVWRLNLAAFYMDITDIHISKAIGGLWLPDNADKAHSLGAEMEGVWLPVNGLELSAAVSAMQAEYDDFDLGAGVKLDGKHLQETPNHSLRVSASYHHPSGLYGRADVRHVGNVYYYDDIAKAMQKADAYTLANLRLGWLYGNWDIYAVAQNLTDDEYISFFRSGPMTGGLAGFGDPRSICAGVSYHF
ncbi:MAG: TonB-dependent siderophore receptor [Deltaproteobacteria bacterium]|nr:MAG: TonB-dependent siderophore receptor [Deltaproteobacteria bacterium]